MSQLLVLLFCTFAQQPSTHTYLLPHFTFKDGGWMTELSLHNAGFKPATVEVRAYDHNGNPAGETQWQLPAKGGKIGRIDQLIPNLSAETGWLEMSAPLQDLRGLMKFTATRSGGSSSLPISSNAAQRLVLPLAEMRGSWRSGLAVVNPNPNTTQLTIMLKAEDGRVLDIHQQSLQPRAKMVAMLADLFPKVPATAQAVLESQQPISAFALSAAGDLSQLVAVPAGILPGGPDTPVTDMTAVYGTWQRLGYGEFMIISSQGIEFLETVDGSCAIPDFDLAAEEVSALIELQQTHEGILRFVAPLLKETRFYRKIAQLPEPCPQTNDPLANFEVFADVVKRYFAFSETVNLDWDLVVQTRRPQVKPDTSDRELFELLSGMLALTQDGHGGLINHQQEFSSENPGAWLLDVHREFQAQSVITDFETFFNQQVQLWRIVLNTYVSHLTSGANGQITWGRIDDKTGYLGVFGMAGYHPDEDDFPANIEALHSAIDRAFEQLNGVETMIIDNRLNPGGSDFYAFELASRFAAEKRLAYSKAGRYGDGMLPYLSHWLTPNQEHSRFEGNLVLLTSSQTFSGGEIFTLFMRAIPDLVHLGEPTGGQLSDALTKTLPNGWRMRVSNEVYLAPDGSWYEYVGIPPQLVMPHFPLADRRARRDRVLEKAMTLFP